MDSLMLHEYGSLLLAFFFGVVSMVCVNIAPKRMFLSSIFLGLALCLSFEAGRVHGILSMRDAVIGVMHEQKQQEGQK